MPTANGSACRRAMVFGVKDSPLYLAGAFDLAATMIEGESKVEQAFRSGNGVRWGERAGCLFCSVGSFFSPTYVNSIVQSWIPALDGVEAKAPDRREVEFPSPPETSSATTSSSPT